MGANVSVPKDTTKHIAAYLSASSTSSIPAAAISQALLEQQGKSRPSQALSVLNTMGRVGQSAAMLSIPNELLQMVKANLDPSDVVCLALTCRELFQRLDYQLIDIKNTATNITVNPRSKKLGMEAQYALMEQRFDVTDRLDRDRVKELVSSELLTDSLLACKACRKVHPRNWFSAEQQQVEVPEQRICLASEARVEICEHVSEDMMSLRAVRRKLACNSKVFNPNTRSCRRLCQEHSRDIYEGTPMISFSMGHLLNNRRFDISCRTKGTFLSSDFDPSSLQPHLDSIATDGAAICPHIALNDPEVLEVIRQDSDAPIISSMTYKTDVGAKGECKECKTSWWFSVEKDWSSLIHPREKETLILRVSQKLEEFGDPWSDQWLCHVEGGMALQEACN